MAAGVILGLAAIALLVRSNLKASLSDDSLVKQSSVRYDAPTIRTMIDEKAPENLRRSIELCRKILEGLLSDRESALRTAKSDASEFFDDLSAARGIYYRMALSDKKPSEADFDARYCYFRAFTNMREVGRSLQGLAKLARDHVANRHRIYEGRLADDLRTLVGLLEAMKQIRERQSRLFPVFHANAQKALQALSTAGTNPTTLLRHSGRRHFDQRFRTLPHLPSLRPRTHQSL
ncbi:MAG: hypothetical protein V8T46_10215 [Sutterella seckii]